MRITVAISTKNNAAPPVTERVLSTQESLTARAVTELYSNGSDVNNHGVSMPLQSLILPGDIVETHDVDQGDVWRARNKSVQLSISAKGVQQTIALERPL